MEVFYYNQCGVHENFSVGFIYGNRDEKESHTEGMTGYQACGHLVKDGDVKSAVFDNPGSAPSIVEKVNEFKANVRTGGKRHTYRRFTFAPKM